MPSKMMYVGICVLKESTDSNTCVLKESTNCDIDVH